MRPEAKRVLLAPLDPVHDVGVRMIAKALERSGHQVNVMPPDFSPEEVVKRAVTDPVDFILVGRTIGYGAAEVLARLADLTEAAGLRPRVKLVIGGMAVGPELAAELGYDAGFGPGTDPVEVVAFVEGRGGVVKAVGSARKAKADVTARYDYAVAPQFAGLLDTITGQILQWAADKSSAGVERGHIREEMILAARDGGGDSALRQKYVSYCDGAAAAFYQTDELPSGVRAVSESELAALQEQVHTAQHRGLGCPIQHVQGQPLVFIQYGTGCPVMDVLHIKAAEAWGADAVLHFDPTWNARTEGYLEGVLTQSETGTLYTPEIIRLIKGALDSGTMLTLRAHRGLNTPETVVLAGLLGADMVKIDIAYGSLHGGTDPARLTVDGVESLRYAAKYKLPYDIPGNDELSGVPTARTFAGMLISAALGLKLGARPMLTPLFCYSPNVILEGRMELNYVDYNVARVAALRRMVNAPIRTGEPVAFMTHTEDRVQSAVTTSLHAALAASLGVDAVTIASTDEAYSRGAISLASRIDTLKGVREAFRFFGSAGIQPTAQAEVWASEIVADTRRVLEQVAARKDFVAALYEGLLGSVKEGAHPGKTGRDSVTSLSGRPGGTVAR